jgi:hypothetical protein
MSKKPDLSHLKHAWPSGIVARKEFSRFSGGAISPGTLANADSRGEGIEGAFVLGRQVCYPVDNAISWLEDRMLKKLK